MECQIDISKKKEKINNGFGLFLLKNYFDDSDIHV